MDKPRQPNFIGIFWLAPNALLEKNTPDSRHGSQSDEPHGARREVIELGSDETLLTLPWYHRLPMEQNIAP